MDDARVLFGEINIVVQAGKAKLVIEDETVMDGDRECVNDVGDVLLSRCLSEYRPIAPLNNYLFKSILLLLVIYSLYPTFYKAPLK